MCKGICSTLIGPKFTFKYIRFDGPEDFELIKSIVLSYDSKYKPGVHIEYCESCSIPYIKIECNNKKKKRSILPYILFRGEYFLYDDGRKVWEESSVDEDHFRKNFEVVS